MKVKCEYCESYVEADENMKCPLCNAPLGSSVEAVQKREEEAEQAEYEREAEEREQEAKNTHISEVIQGVANVASSVVAGVTATNIANATGSNRYDERRPMPPGGMPKRVSAFGREGGPHRESFDSRSDRPHEDKHRSETGSRSGNMDRRPGGMSGHPNERR